MELYVLALLIGVIAGLRAMTAPAAICWAAYLGRLPLEGTPLSFLGYVAVPYVVTLAALGELVTDQLPQTPSRKVPVQFGTRIVVGALCGAAIGAPAGLLVGGAVAGVVGAVIGTLGGAAVRSGLARAMGSDRPAAVIEDLVAIVGAAAIIGVLP
jgi:uncharacterized membrane protein